MTEGIQICLPLSIPHRLYTRRLFFKRQTHTNTLSYSNDSDVN
jgi:hypothetical protein